MPLPANPLWILLNSWPANFDRFILRDVIVNVALYVPAGVTGHLAFRKFGKPWVSFVAPVLICTSVSASIEMIQLFVPSRDTSALDLLTNIAGSAIGVFLGAIMEEVIALRQARRGLHRPRTAVRQADRAALALLVCWIVWLWFPLFPVLGRTVLGQKLELFLQTPLLQVAPFLSAALAWFAAGNLLRAGGFRPARILTAISVFLIPAQLFIVDRQPTPPALAGAAIGAACFALLWACRKAHIYRSFTAWTFLGVIAVRGLTPFQFSPTAAPFSWIPFSGFLNMNWQAGIQVIAEKFFWYGTAIWLLGTSGMRIRTATALVAATLLGIEIAQTRLPGHVAEITDPLFAVFAGCAVVVMARNSPAAG